MDTVDDDLLEDDLLAPSAKKGARPLVRTPAEQKRAEDAARKQVAKQRLEDEAKQLAQIINLHIAGYSLADIGASIGATEAEVDRMLSKDMARYVRSQPALRTYVRNWISNRYMKMIDADWEAATDEQSGDKLENQDRVMRMLDRMAKLHGAEAPSQAEVTIDAAPEAVERLVQRLAGAQGLAYDTDVFNTPREVVQGAVVESTRELTVSGNRVEETTDDDQPL